MEDNKKRLIVLGIVLGCFILLVLLNWIIGAVKTIKETNDAANNRVAELIVSEVELAYSTAYMNNKGLNPSLEQVKYYFDSYNAIWEEDIIESDKFSCDVEVINSILKVTCLDAQTSDNLILSNK